MCFRFNASWGVKTYLHQQSTGGSVRNVTVLDVEATEAPGYDRMQGAGPNPF